jgi:hypothetical protein
MSGAARTNAFAAASSSIHRPIARYDTGIHELSAPAQSAEATGGPALTPGVVIWSDGGITCK